MDQREGVFKNVENRTPPRQPGSLMTNIYLHRRISPRRWPRITRGLEWNGAVRSINITWRWRTLSVRWWRDQARAERYQPVEHHPV